MDIIQAIENRRTVRRFSEKPVDASVLKQLVRLGRLYLSGANLQPIRFAVVSCRQTREAIFPTLKWAAYLPDFEVTAEQQPQAYIILLRDDTVLHSCKFDVGAAATTVSLAAEHFGLASCCLGSFAAGDLAALLQLPDHIHPELVIALGYPAQSSRAVPCTGSIRYTADENGNFSVPKWSPEEVTVYSDLD